MKKKEEIPLTDEENKSYEKQKVCYLCKKNFADENDKNAFKLYNKVKNHGHYTEKFRGAAHHICNLRYKTPKETPLVFHNVSTYDYRFLIEELAKELKGQLNCFRENTGKYITFSVSTKKELENSIKLRTK